MKMQKQRKDCQCCGGYHGGAKAKNSHCSYSEGIIAFIVGEYAIDVLREPCQTSEFHSLTKPYPLLAHPLKQQLCVNVRARN
jgi:hypothetical protein